MGSLQLYPSFWAIDVKYRGVGSRKIKLLLCYFPISVITPLRTKSLVDALWIYVNDLPQNLILCSGRAGNGF